MRKPHVPDGTLLGGADGRLMRVFTPRWWQVLRWLEWWRAPVRGTVTITRDNGSQMVLRVVAAPAKLAPGCAAPGTPVLDIDHRGDG